MIHLLFKPRTFRAGSDSQAAAGACHRPLILLSSVRSRCPLVKSHDRKELLDCQQGEMRRVLERLPPHRLISVIQTVRGMGMMYGFPGSLRDCPSTSIESGGVVHLVRVTYVCCDHRRLTKYRETMFEIWIVDEKSECDLQRADTTLPRRFRTCALSHRHLAYHRIRIPNLKTAEA